jgi:hypothetical protein
MELKEIVDFYGKRGFDVIAITDHQLDEISKRLPKNILPVGWISNEKDFNEYYLTILDEAKRAWNEYEMLVIPGIEFTNYIANVHIVSLNIKRYIEVESKMVQTLIVAKNDGCLLIGAHPWDTKFYRIGGGLWRNKEISPWIDAWEAGNGVDTFPHVLMNGYRYVANTDFHGELRDNGINGWKTLIKAKKTTQDVLKAIMDKRTAIHKYKDGEL